MQIPENHDTAGMWSALVLLLNFLAISAIMCLAYLVLGSTIHAYLDKPKYTDEQLLALGNKRAQFRKQERADDWDLVENGIHVKTGLKNDENLKLIIGACTSCHSSKLIIQNRATRQGWKNMIVWMQETQGLHDLGVNEPKILDYLAEHYAPQELGRRKNLDYEELEWYVLDLDAD